MLDFVYLIGLLRRRYEFSVTSWFRTEHRNKVVGGKPNSHHLTGLAVDIVPDREEEKADIIQTASSLGLVAIDEYNHIHIQKGVIK